MKTDIRLFCDEYAKELEPFTTGLKKVLSNLSANKPDDPALNQSCLRLQEVSHRAESLSDKIARQRAYLLIFGPLKSGKSTLMNAISGAYVSEVSSLPAYPALVYVKHGDDRHFQATTYAGEKKTFADSQAMSNAVLNGHEELVRRIIEVEKSGEDFDPQQHFPDAIRRMDVEAPASALEESGSVIVDTPGLYTRMRFGYDLMTKDFRNTASCAIFVVKSDNLFFERVFEEFNQLLGHFSRIFLVVNIDSSKRDLNPDGSFGPSLESTRPEAIVDAFKSLAMSVPLREAYEKGNLNVYTIDLLKAASYQLKKEAGTHNDAEDDPDSYDADTEVGFDNFINDLTSYLDSSDYRHEFMYDNLRLGENLLNEATSIVSGEASDQVQKSVSQFNDELKESNTRLNALEKLEEIDWSEAFLGVQEEKDKLLKEFEEKNSQLGVSLNKALDQWMDTDDSLKALQDVYLNRHIDQQAAGDTSAILDSLRELLDSKYAGAHFSAEKANAIEQAELHITPQVKPLLKKLGSQEEPDSRILTLDAQVMPLKRNMSDYLLFRNNKVVRQRFFGEDNEAPIPAAEKQKRISSRELEALRATINRYPKSELPDVQRKFVDRVLNHHIEDVSKIFQQQQTELKTKLKERKTELEKKLESNAELKRILQQLLEASWKFEESVDELRGRYQIGSIEELRDENESDDEVSLIDDADSEDNVSAMPRQ